MYAIVTVALMYMVAYEGFVYCSIFLLFNRVASRHCCMSLYMEFDYNYSLLVRLARVAAYESMCCLRGDTTSAVQLK